MKSGKGYFYKLKNENFQLQVSSRSQPDSSVRTAIAEGKDVHILHESGKLIQSLAFPSNVQQVTCFLEEMLKITNS